MMTPPDSKEDRVSDGRAPVVTVFNGWEERGQSGPQRAGLMTCGWEGGRACRKQTWKRKCPREWLGKCQDSGSG